MITTGLITLLVSTVVGGILKLVASKMEYNHQLESAKLAALNAKARVVDQARQYPQFQFTRRFIAIFATIAILGLPLLVPVWHMWLYPIDVLRSELQPSVWFGYEVLVSGFWPFTDTVTNTIWKDFKGLVITPFHVEVFSAIIGFYFGARLGNGRM